MNHPSALSFLISSCVPLFPLPSPEDVLGALRGVIGRRHPSTAQSRQLKHTLPTLSVVLELLLSQVGLDFVVRIQGFNVIGCDVHKNLPSTRSSTRP